MTPFEQLLVGSSADLHALLERFGVLAEQDQDQRLERLAQRLGVNVSQLVCGVGFNPAAEAVQRLPAWLGFASYDALVGERNYLFINDLYRQLSIDDVVEIYGQLRLVPDPDNALADLLASRLNHIESQIEATINPVMIGSYKLEIRALYENHLASAELLELRLRPESEVLRGIADEIMLIARSGTVPAARLLAHAGVSAEEKRRLLFHDLVSREAVAARLADPAIPARERELLAEALERAEP